MTILLWAVTLSADAAPPVQSLPSIPGAVALLDRLDATPSQREALRQIAAETLLTLDQVARGEALRIADDVAGALTGPEVDRDRLESARRDAVDLVDRASSTLIPSVADAAELLTQEQRQRAARILRQEAIRRLGLGDS
jgi:hypothetical protein